MHRTPPHEDTHSDGEPERDLRRHNYKDKLQQELDDPDNYDPYNHPEIPRIKRASRYLDLESTPPPTRQPSQNNRRARLEKPRAHQTEDELQLARRMKAREAREQTERARVRRPPPHAEAADQEERTRIRRPVRREELEEEQRPPTRRPARRPIEEQEVRASSRRPIDEDDETLIINQSTRRKPRVYFEDEPEAPVMPAKATRVPQAQAIKEHTRRPAAYEQSTIEEAHERVARRNRHTQQVIFDQAQRILHNRPLLAVICGILILGVLLPLGIHLLSAPSIGSGVPQGGAQSTLTRTATAAKNPADPHEIVITPPDTDHPAPPVLATSAYVLDADTGATIYAHNPFMHIPMMSTTKLMTALLAVEHGNLDQKVTINRTIARDLTTLSADSALMGIKPGETYTMRELLYGLFLVSGNDAALAIADADAGSVPNFVAQMNQRAKQLGMNDTHYMNPHGLMADGQYSSAHDLAIIGQHSFGNATIQQISDTEFYTIPATKEHAVHYLQNEDQFMYWYPGVMAGKTGWDTGANFLQVVKASYHNKHLIGVTMHTVDWWTDMRDLMNYGFNNFTWISPREINASIKAIPYAALWSYFQSDTRQRIIPMGKQGRFYIFTEYAISGVIMNYFDKNHGLNKFGYPTSSQTAPNTTILMQHFQHGTIQCNLQTKECGTV
ncbi:D-alanyl-D-alanine carboxypeptidase family protein [Dictyobacter arantiisoli]|uniref:Peptidase S11 D-alanyl-D-alanine carboxypeptidase A N-terminal domain-containing protein n=1 Tax=Dictyobacter arantiisoli TaxID=2014874 RepID=A0A5A5T8V7_9CHLR|nr:serine hydrolase [Dictyobacter arantiisoli]GCF07777.1 hypothetical protein KDI_13410 [Dictyobacter arantiisoli]